MDTGYDRENNDTRMPVSTTPVESYIKSFTLADEIPIVAYTRPAGFTFLGTEYTIWSWSGLIVELAKLVRRGKHGDLLDEVMASDINFTGRLCIAHKPEGMIEPRQIDDTLWIETNFGAKQMVDFAKWLTWWCDIEPSSVIISYVSKTNFPRKNRELKEQVASRDTNCIEDFRTISLVDAQKCPFAFTSPVYFEFLGKEYKITRWIELTKSMLNILLTLSDKGQMLLHELGNVSFPLRGLLRNSATGMHRPYEVRPGIYLETNYNSKDCVINAKRIAEYAGIDLVKNPCVVYYFEKESKKVPQSFSSMGSTSETPGNNCIASNYSLNGSAEQPLILNRLREVLLTHYPDGLRLSPAGLQLLKGQVPPECAEIVNPGNLRKMLFRCGDDCWLLPEMIAAASTQDKLRGKIVECVSRYSSYALSNLLTEFAPYLGRVTSALRDFAAYVSFCILPLGMEITGHGEEMQCVWRGKFSKVSFREKTAEEIRKILYEAGDAMTEEELLSNLPYLNSAILWRVCLEGLPTAISFQLDGVAYWKLLENYWLPEDFSSQLSLIVPRLENVNAVATLPRIQQELQDVYGISFREDYAMADDDVFRQVIAASWQGPAYVWKKGTSFVADGTGKTASHPSTPTVLDAFLQDHHGVFHEDDFVKYAKAIHGLKSPSDLLVLVLLVPTCIRLSERQWIAPKDFFVQDIFSEEEWQSIEQRLLSYLGSNPFLPVGELPQAFYDDLKSLEIQGATFYWNAYLLSSVAQFHLNKLKIVNTTVAPYAMTGMFIPFKVQIDNRDKNGVIDYSLRYWPRQDGVIYSVDEAFAFLKDHRIRLRKSKILLEYLDVWLKEHTHV